MKVEWHPLAHSDLAELLTYVAMDSLEAAYRVHDEIRKQTGMLASHPDIGRLGRVGGTRELAIIGRPYVIADRIDHNAVTVLRLLHGARRWPVGV